MWKIAKLSPVRKKRDESDLVHKIPQMLESGIKKKKLLKEFSTSADAA